MLLVYPLGLCLARVWGALGLSLHFLLLLLMHSLDALGSFHFVRVIEVEELGTWPEGMLHAFLDHLFAYFRSWVRD